MDQASKHSKFLKAEPDENDNPGFSSSSKKKLGKWKSIHNGLKSIANPAR